MKKKTLTEKEAKRLLEAEEKKDWKETQRELDTLFDKQNETKYDGIPAFVHSKGLKNEISLYQYQHDGIRWLLHQETADRIPPFWTERMLGHAQNKPWWYWTLTRKMQKDAPKSSMGSIWADNMGLGKTLQSICLILSNHPDLDEGEPCCTLIVSPVSVIANWDQQIENC